MAISLVEISVIVLADSGLASGVNGALSFCAQAYGFS